VRDAKLHEEILVDASWSSDPDYDAIELDWRAEEASAGLPECRGWRQQEGRLHFRASVPATCTFVVTAREVVGRQHAIGTVVIRAMDEPRVRPGENQLVYASGPTRLRLGGECESCSGWRWSQVAGPLSTEPIECNGAGGEAPHCEVRARVAGEYSFALVGWNGQGEDRKEITVTVAPPPAAVVFVPPEAIVHHRYVLDGSASHDPLGGELRYRWEVSRRDFEDCYAPRPDDEEEGAGHEALQDVRLSTPTDARTEFTSATVHRDLYVRLTVASVRTVGGRATSTTACAIRKLPVLRPTWLFSFAAGSDWEARDAAWGGTHGSAVIAVRPGWSRLPWLGVRFEQNLVRNDGEGTPVIALGGTTAGLTAFWARWFHPYAAGYFRTWGRSALGAQLGVDFRVQRFAFATVGGRAEYRNADEAVHGVITAALGVGYDW
jgi:hypothetical protein